MTTNKTMGTGRSTQSQKGAEPATLVQCYGAIGISAVAAAVRYQGAAKNPAYAPAPGEKMLDWASEAAA